MKIWSRLLCALPLCAMLAAAPAIARDVTDSMGTVTVPDAPKRIVVLTNEGTEALLALGVTPVGAANSWNGDPWWDHISDAMDGAEPVGKESAVNLELIAALEPDLILANKQRHEEIYPQLTAIAPTVMSKEQYHCRYIYQWHSVSTRPSHGCVIGKVKSFYCLK